MQNQSPTMLLPLLWPFFLCVAVGAKQDRRTLKNSVFARHGIAANRPKSINVNNNDKAWGTPHVANGNRQAPMIAAVA